eukprot:Rhum_TRINITY_DN14163_c20_g1::Rhum_TRINITY_DN14163_c20_g1_i1::g.69510::m.69510
MGLVRISGHVVVFFYKKELFSFLSFVFSFLFFFFSFLLRCGMLCVCLLFAAADAAATGARPSQIHPAQLLLLALALSRLRFANGLLRSGRRGRRSRSLREIREPSAGRLQAPRHRVHPRQGHGVDGRQQVDRARVGGRDEAVPDELRATRRRLRADGHRVLLALLPGAQLRVVVQRHHPPLKLRGQRRERTRVAERRLPLRSVHVDAHPAERQHVGPRRCEEGPHQRVTRPRPVRRHRLAVRVERRAADRRRQQRLPRPPTLRCDRRRCAASSTAAAAAAELTRCVDHHAASRGGGEAEGVRAAQLHFTGGTAACLKVSQVRLRDAVRRPQQRERARRLRVLRAAVGGVLCPEPAGVDDAVRVHPLQQLREAAEAKARRPPVRVDDERQPPQARVLGVVLQERRHAAAVREGVRLRRHVAEEDGAAYLVACPAAVCGQRRLRLGHVRVRRPRHDALHEREGNAARRRELRLAQVRVEVHDASCGALVRTEAVRQQLAHGALSAVGGTHHGDAHALPTRRGVEEVAPDVVRRPQQRRQRRRRHDRRAVLCVVAAGAVGCALQPAEDGPQHLLLRLRVERVQVPQQRRPVGAADQQAAHGRRPDRRVLLQRRGPRDGPLVLLVPRRRQQQGRLRGVRVLRPAAAPGAAHALRRRAAPQLEVLSLTAPDGPPLALPQQPAHQRRGAQKRLHAQVEALRRKRERVSLLQAHEREVRLPRRVGRQVVAGGRDPAEHVRRRLRLVCVRILPLIFGSLVVVVFVRVRVEPRPALCSCGCVVARALVGRLCPVSLLLLLLLFLFLLQRHRRRLCGR